MSRGQISYCIPLYNLAGNFEPKRILELGCGCSTFIMRWIWPKAEMVVVDDHPVWMRTNENMGAYKINKRVIVHSKEEFEKEIAGNGKFDLIFLDSGHGYDKSDMWRSDFIKLIRESEILNPNGILLLHDATRDAYQEECIKWSVRAFYDYKTYLLKKQGRDVFFFRDDDVSIFQPHFHDFMEIFVEKKVPINLEVIPEQLTVEMTEVLNKYIKENPGLIEIHLHGYNHAQNEPWNEYPESREESAVKAELLNGNIKLKKLFESTYFPILTPPWNNFSPKFMPLLPALCFVGMSTGKSFDFPNLQDYHACMDISYLGVDCPGGRFMDLKEMITKYEEVRDSSNFIGCILHHSRFWMKENNPLQTIRNFIKYLKNNKVEIVKMSEVHNGAV